MTEPVALAARDLGEMVRYVDAARLRNIAEPVGLYDIDLAPRSASAVDPMCAMTVPTTGATAIRLRHDDRDVCFCSLPCLARYATA